MSTENSEMVQEIVLPFIWYHCAESLCHVQAEQREKSRTLRVSSSTCPRTHWRIRIEVATDDRQTIHYASVLVIPSLLFQEIMFKDAVSSAVIQSGEKKNEVMQDFIVQIVMFHCVILTASRNIILWKLSDAQIWINFVKINYLQKVEKSLCSITSWGWRCRIKTPLTLEALRSLFCKVSFVIF